MNLKIASSIVISTLLCVACSNAIAQENFPPLAHDETSWQDAPENLKAYVLASRRAAENRDPLRKCLETPPLPGATGGEELLRLRCVRAWSRRVPASEFKMRIERGDYDGLEKVYAEMLARHFAKGAHFSEEVDYIFEFMHDSPKDEYLALAQKWLVARPDSAFAYTAVGWYYAARAFDARGTDYISETEAKKLRQMDEFVSKAQPYLKRAIELNPRMMPAHIMRVHLALIAGTSKEIGDAYRLGSSQDRACVQLNEWFLGSLQPKYGGSLEQMTVFEKHLLSMENERPELGIFAESIDGYVATQLESTDKHDEEAWELLQPMLKSYAGRSELNAAARIQSRREVKSLPNYNAFIYDLQLARFQIYSGNHARRLIAATLDAGDNAWAKYWGELSLREYPDNLAVRLLYGMALVRMKEFTTAIEVLEPMMIVARKDRGSHATPLLLEAILGPDEVPDEAKRLAMAQKYLRMMRTEDPTSGETWLWQVMFEMRSNKEVDAETERNFRKYMDPKNERHERTRVYLDNPDLFQ